MVKYCTIFDLEAWMNLLKPGLMRSIGYFIADGTNRRRLTRSFTEESWKELLEPILQSICQVRVLKSRTGKFELSALFHDNEDKPVAYKAIIDLTQEQYDMLPEVPRETFMHIKSPTAKINEVLVPSMESMARAMEILEQAFKTAGTQLQILTVSIPPEFVKHLK